MKSEVKNILFYAGSAVLMLIIIGFTSIRNAGKKVKDVAIVINNRDGDFYLDQMEIMNLLNASKSDFLTNLSLDQVDLKMLESRMEVHPFVRDAQVSRDIKGNLIVHILQAEPIARIFRGGKDDLYIDTDGNLLPTATKHTARVPMVHLKRTFSWEQSITETDYGQKVLNLLKYITKDEFWKAQIAGVIVNKDGGLTLMPQVTKQDILFGMPEDFDEKFRKLKIFYKEILPSKGWNTYSQVNLQFKNQIVCK